jgi:hypothetical protein
MRTGSPTVGEIVFTKVLIRADLPEWRGARHPERMGTPPAARTPRHLVIKGGFTVIDTQQRRLDEQARRLGFADLRGCLQALLGDGWSIPQLANHLDTT